MEQIQFYEAQLDKVLVNYPVLIQFEEKTKIKKTYAVGGVGFIVLVLIFTGIGAALLSNLVGFIYPAYESFKAIESVDTADDTHWLTYWVVFAFFNTIEYFSDILLFWIPFYYVFKTALLIWLYYPGTRGAELVYHRFLRQFLFENQNSIDTTLNSVGKKAREEIQKAEKKIYAAASEKIKEQTAKSIDESFNNKDD